MRSTPPTSRAATPIDAVADRHLQTMAALDPCLATKSGISGGFNDDITDYSPDAAAARAEAASATLRELDGLHPADDVDIVTVAAMRERLGVAVELHEAGLDVGELNVIDSPLQRMREVFDLMPTDTDDDWAVVGRRLAQLPERVGGYADGLRAAVATGRPPAIRQVSRGIEQANTIAEFFVDMVADAALDSPALSAELQHHAAAAAEAYRNLAEVLRAEIAPHARSTDACGREAYRLLSRGFLGATVDLDETYHWGLTQLENIVAEQEALSEQLYPGSSVTEALRLLEDEPQYLLHGTDALRTWIQKLSDRAVKSLAGHHFDIPAPLQRLECRIAPTQTGGIYYTGPSEDLARPGRMWWSVPPDMHTFHTWHETTTVFHEGVPGHHLQTGRAVMMADQLNRWRRMGCWVAGHGEGWALYAERLMAELGWLDDPGDRMGMLDAQRFRAARVVVDIGVHCGITAPNGERWDADKVETFMADHSAWSHKKLRFEVDRYLGWPGQAPSYAVGQRIWQQLRNETLSLGISLKEFHSRALGLGGLGLDVLRSALLGDFAAG